MCVHEADPYLTNDGMTDYGARCEGLGHVEDGPHVVAWEPGQTISDGWEMPTYFLPGGWFLTADIEKMANPVRWAPIPGDKP